MKKHYWSYVEVSDDSNNGASFVITLKNKSRFILNGCYFTIYKELFEANPNSDYFIIELVTELARKDAENTMRKAIDFLVYITGVSYELDYLREDSNLTINPIDVCISKEKITRLTSINLQYEKIRKKRELLESVLKLNALATKYALVLEDSEEAYFAWFRVVEKIAKDEYELEHTNIITGYSNIRTMVEKIIHDIYGIKYPSNKLDDLAGKFSAEIKNIVFSDIYSKIAWYCEKKSIPYDENSLLKAVKQRNKLAHGENINIDIDSDEYTLILRLAHRFIYEKFFSKVKKCYLESSIII